MQPMVLFDKSALQMLSREELGELTHCFNLISTPTLVREIIADVRKTPVPGRRPPIDVVRDLAGALAQMHPSTPMNFRKLALGELLRGKRFPIGTGQLVVDTDASNIATDGKNLSYDATKEQELWQRWARGDFSELDGAIAAAWRDGISHVDLKALGADWKAFVDEHVGPVKSLAETIVRVDELIAQPDPMWQVRLVVIALQFLRVPRETGVRIGTAAGIMMKSRQLTITTLLPYNAILLRLYLTFVAAIARGFITLRPSNYIDLQYLFYAPFAMGFASADRLHEQLWPATSTPAIFIPGARLKADLAQRAAWRSSLTPKQEREYYAAHSMYPVRLPDSIVNAVWDRWMMPRDAFVDGLKNRRPLEEVQAEIGPELRRMVDEMKAMQAQKDPRAGEWPLGPQPGGDSPVP